MLRSYPADLRTPSPADVRHLHLWQRGRLGGPELRIAVGSPAPDPPNMFGKHQIRGARAQLPAEIVALEAEETRVEAALGRKPRARAAAAEGLRHRRDHADL